MTSVPSWAACCATASPAYRLPRGQAGRGHRRRILSTGIEVHRRVPPSAAISPSRAAKPVRCAVHGHRRAHTDKKTGIPGEDAEGVLSAVQLLRAIGDGRMPDFTGQERGGHRRRQRGHGRHPHRNPPRAAKSVKCVYRRRMADMTALPEEIEGAMAEGCEILSLQAPVAIETDETGASPALWTQPAGDRRGTARTAAPPPMPQPLEHTGDAVIVVAIGQAWTPSGFEQLAGPVSAATLWPPGACVPNMACIRRRRLRHRSGHRDPGIAAGKVAAANIDEYLGFPTTSPSDVEIPGTALPNKPPHAAASTPPSGRPRSASRRL